MRIFKLVFHHLHRLSVRGCLPLMMFSWIGTAHLCADTVTLTHLRCENLIDPLGIDVAKPRFSWIIESDRQNEKQSAYQVVVDGQWDSGRVASEQSINVEYGGKELAPATRYTWKVRIWDAEGKTSEWSKPATFSTSLMDWSAKWIGGDKSAGSGPLDGAQWIWFPEGNPTQSAPAGTRYFRHTITLPPDRKVTKATFGITADNAFELSINGKKAGQGDNWKQPSTVDVTSLLQAKDNTIEVTATNTGHGPSSAGLIAKLHIEFSEGDPLDIVTDGQWEAATAPDSSWTAAKALGANGIAPWGTVGDSSFPAPELRKEVDTPGAIRRARAYVCGLGLYELHLNGQRVGDRLLEQPFADYRKRVLYNTYDVTTQWRTGRNAIGVLLGTGWYDLPADDHFGNGHAPWKDRPKLLLHIDVEFADGSKRSIVSDETWKHSTGPITYNSIRGGEDYDARLEQPGWDKPNFNDSLWHPAVVVSAPQGKLVSSKLYPARLTEVVPPVTITPKGAGVWVFDFGKNLAGWARLTVSGVAGQRIEIRFPGAASHTQGRYQTENYILKGNGLEVYEPRFTHHGFSKAIVSGLTETPTANTLVGCNVHSDLPSAGKFECSDERLNKLQSVLLYTADNYNLHFPADPTREKAGWVQDVQNMFPTQMLNFDSAAMYENWLDDMRDAQDARGYEPPIAPNPGHYYDGSWNCVWWSGMIVYLPWELYQYTGDETILADNYPAMKGYVDWLRSIEGKTNNWCRQRQPLGPSLNYTNTSLSGLTIWGLGDWAAVKATPVALTETCGSAYFNRLVSETAQIIGNNSDADFYAQESARITSALNKTFLDPVTGWYATHSQTGQLLPLVLGLVPDEKRSLATDKLAASIAASDNHLSTGFEGTPFLLTGLCDVGLSDLAWTVATQPGAPGWFDIVFTRKNSTFMEYWNGGGVQMPACQGPIGEWFIRDLAGINPAAPGFKKILIKPSIVGDLTWVNACYDSLYGRIVSDWKLEGNQLTMDITIPANTTATIIVPGKNGGSHEVGSGLYHFTSRMSSQ